MIDYENEVAVKCGINAAVIADYDTVFLHPYFGRQ